MFHDFLVLPQQGLRGAFFYQGETEGKEQADKKEMYLKLLAHSSLSVTFPLANLSITEKIPLVGTIMVTKQGME